MPTDTAPIQVTAAVITSGAEAIRTAREFAASIADGVIERDRSGLVPARELAALDASGLLAITVPRKYQGAEVPATVLAEVIRAIAAVDPAIAQIPQGHFLLVDVLAVLGTPEQRRRLFADVLIGGRLGNGLAERGGRHAQDLQTRLTRHGPLVRLTGRKYYCTGAITARWIGVTALDDADRLVLAFVERDAPGVQLDSNCNVMGQRATVSGGAQFDDVPVDPELVIPYQGAFEAPQQFGARAQLVHAAIEVGIARGALRDAGEFVRTRARPFFEELRPARARGGLGRGTAPARPDGQPPAGGCARGAGVHRRARAARRRSRDHRRPCPPRGVQRQPQRTAGVLPRHLRLPDKPATPRLRVGDFMIAKPAVLESSGD